jgi:hypothetical protein
MNRDFRNSFTDQGNKWKLVHLLYFTDSNLNLSSCSTNRSVYSSTLYYKVVQIWSRRFVCKQVTVCPGHIWTTLCINYIILLIARIIRLINTEVHSKIWSLFYYSAENYFETVKSQFGQKIWVKVTAFYKSKIVAICFKLSAYTDFSDV